MHMWRESLLKEEKIIWFLQSQANWRKMHLWNYPRTPLLSSSSQPQPKNHKERFATSIRKAKPTNNNPKTKPKSRKEKVRSCHSRTNILDNTVTLTSARALAHFVDNKNVSKPLKTIQQTTAPLLSSAFAPFKKHIFEKNKETHAKK